MFFDKFYGKLKQNFFLVSQIHYEFWETLKL